MAGSGALAFYTCPSKSNRDSQKIFCLVKHLGVLTSGIIVLDLANGFAKSTEWQTYVVRNLPLKLE
jgi:hypothetical protein